MRLLSRLSWRKHLGKGLAVLVLPLVVVIVWQLMPVRPRTTLPGNDRVNLVAFSPDGRTLAVVGSSRSNDEVQWEEMPASVRLWDLEHNRERLRLHGAWARAEGLGFSPDGRLLAASGRRGFLRLWDAVTGELLIDIAPVQGFDGAVEFRF